MPTGADWDKGSALNMKEARRLTTGHFEGRVEHKYDYSAVQSEIPAFGWASTKENIGLYFINPSMEYLSSGPLHPELTGHLDDDPGGDPTLLDYWRGTHYGGSILPIDAGEKWSKVVGPIFVYVNKGAAPEALFQDARSSESDLPTLMIPASTGRRTPNTTNSRSRAMPPDSSTSPTYALENISCTPSPTVCSANLPGLVSGVRQAIPGRRHLHHRKERLSQRLVLRTGPALNER